MHIPTCIIISCWQLLYCFVYSTEYLLATWCHSCGVSTLQASNHKETSGKHQPCLLQAFKTMDSLTIKLYSLCWDEFGDPQSLLLYFSFFHQSCTLLMSCAFSFPERECYQFIQEWKGALGDCWQLLQNWCQILIKCDFGHGGIHNNCVSYHDPNHIWLTIVYNNYCCKLPCVFLALFFWHKKLNFSLNFFSGVVKCKNRWWSPTLFVLLSSVQVCYNCIFQLLIQILVNWDQLFGLWCVLISQ